MEHWNYNWDDSREFEQPLTLQDYEFHLGLHHGVMKPQPFPQKQCYEPLQPSLEAMATQLLKSSIDNANWLREFEERSAKLDQLIEQIQANRLLEQDQGLTSLHSSELSDSNSLPMHNDIDVHSFGVKRENNVPLDHVDFMHHDFTIKEDGNREEGNVPSEKQTLDKQRESALEPRHKVADKKKKKKKNGLMTEVFDIFTKVDVNFPLLDLISQVPTYAEFVKNLCMHKKKFHDEEKIMLKEVASAIIQHRASPDKHDPTSFVIGCTIGDKFFDGAFMDMCACINIMPLATFRKLAIGTLQPTSISMQLADETFRMPVGIVEDVLVRVEKFILPADFVILDMDEDPKIESGLPIILGRPFMAMAGAKINVKKGTVKLKVLGEKVKLQVLQPTFPHNVNKECFQLIW